VNLSGYIMKWTDIQLPPFDPVHLGKYDLRHQRPSYKVKGFEVQFVRAPHRGAHGGRLDW